MKETTTKGERIAILEENEMAQARLFKETSLAHGKEVQRCQSKICNLERGVRRLKESAQQTLDEKEQVSHAHIYVQTLLHKQHIQTSHGVVSSLFP